MRLRGQLSAFALSVVLFGGVWSAPVKAQSIAATTLPQGGTVVVGAAAIKQAGSALSVTTATDRTAINWNSFSIGAAASVAIQQPNANAITVNQVTGIAPSQIFGSLTSNGRVVVANPNGIWFASGSHVDTAGLVASTATASSAALADFARGQALRLDQAGLADASVVNDGKITIANAGLAALVAPGVANNGVIVADLGTVQLGSATTAVVDFYGDGLMHFALGQGITAAPKGPDGKPLKAAVGNAGKIIARGGHIAMTAGAVKGVVDQAINLSGVAKATSVATQGGDIVLDGGDGATTVSGTLDVSSKSAAGGSIQVTGNSVAVSGKVKADGATGGSIEIGGGPRGTGSLAHAKSVSIASGATISAKGHKGKGGSIVLWSEGLTQAAASLEAAGTTGGGTIETSGQTLDLAGIQVDAGSTGQWLLDPYDLTIDASLAATVASSLNAGTSVTLTVGSSGAPSGATIPAGDRNASGTGKISVESPISWTGSGSLALNAYNQIAVDASITTTGSGSISLNASGGGTGGLLSVASGASVSSSGGSVQLTGNSLTIDGALSGSSVYFIANGTGGLAIDSGASVTAAGYLQIATQNASGTVPVAINGTVNVTGTSSEFYAVSNGTAMAAYSIGGAVTVAGYYGIVINAGNDGSIAFTSGGSLTASYSNATVTLSASTYTLPSSGAAVHAANVGVNETGGTSFSLSPTFLTALGAGSMTGTLTLANVRNGTFAPVTLTGTETAAGSLTIQAAGITVATGAAYSAAGTISLTTQNTTSAISVQNGASLTAGSTLTLTAPGVLVDGSATGANVTFNVSGTAGLTVDASGSVTATNGSISLSQQSSTGSTVTINGTLAANGTYSEIYFSSAYGPTTLTIGGTVSSAGYYGIQFYTGDAGTITINSGASLTSSYSGSTLALSAASYTVPSSGVVTNIPNVSLYNTSGTTFSLTPALAAAFGASNATGSFSVQNALEGVYKPVTLSGTMNFGGALRVTGSTISVAGGAAITAAGEISLAATSGYNLSVASGASLTSTASDVTLSGDLITVDGGVTGTAVSLSFRGGGLALDAGSAITASNGSITFSSQSSNTTSVALNGTVTQAGLYGEVYLYGYYDAVNLTIGGAVTAAGYYGISLEAGAAGSLTITQGGSLTASYSGATIAIGAGSFTLPSSGAELSASNITISERNASPLVLTAAQLTAFGAGNATTGFTVYSYDQNGSYQQVTLSGAINFAGAATVYGSSITLPSGAAITAGGAVTLTTAYSTGGNVTVASGASIAASGTSPISLTGNTVTIDGAVTGGSVSLTSTGSGGLIVDTGASVTATNGSITLYSSAYGVSNAVITLNGTLTANGTYSEIYDSLYYGTGAVTIGGTVSVSGYYGIQLYAGDTGTMTLNAGASLSASYSGATISLSAATFNLPSSSSTPLLNAANISLSASGSNGFTLGSTQSRMLGASTATGGFTISTYSNANSSYMPLTLSDTQSFAGSLSIYSSSLTLTSGNTITAAGGIYVSAYGTSTSNTTIAVQSGAGLVATGGTVSLYAGTITVDGTVSGTSVSLESITTGGIAVDAGASVTATNGSVTFTSAASGNTPILINGTVSASGLYSEIYTYTYGTGADITIGGAVSATGYYGISLNAGSTGSITLATGASLSETYSSGPIYFYTNALAASSGIAISAPYVYIDNSPTYSSGSIGIGGGAGTLQLSQQFISLLEPPNSSPHVQIGDSYSTIVNDLALSSNITLMGTVTNNVPQIIATLSGTAFSDSGSTHLGAGITIEALLGGAVIGTATTDAQGAYAMSFSPTTAQGSSGSILFLIESGSTLGNTLYEGLYTNATAVSIWGNTLRVLTQQTTYSGVLSSLTGAIGSIGDSHILFGSASGLATGTALNIGAVGSSFEVDRTINLPASTVNLSGNATTIIDAGTYKTAAFTAGAVRLAGAATIDTSASNGAIAIGSLDGASAATINAGTGAVSLGNVGASTVLTSLSVTAGTTTLTGSIYDAGSIALGNIALANSASLYTYATNGTITLGSIQGNGNSLSAYAGTGTISMGAVSSVSELSTSAGMTTLTGTSYQAAYLEFGALTLSGNTSFTASSTIDFASVDAGVTASSAPSITANAPYIQIAANAVLSASSMSFSTLNSFYFDYSASLAAANGFALSIGQNGVLTSYTTASTFTVAGNGVFASAGGATLGGAFNLKGLTAPSVTLIADTVITTPTGQGTGVSVSSITGTHSFYVDSVLLYSGYNALTGIAYSDNGFSHLGAGITIEALLGGAVIGTAATDVNGAYSIPFAPTTNQGSSGAILFVIDSGTVAGNTLYDGLYTSATSIPIWGNTLQIITGKTSYSSALAALGGAIGSVSDSHILFSTTAGLASGKTLDIDATGTSFEIDQAFALPSSAVNLSGTATTILDAGSYSAASFTAGAVTLAGNASIDTSSANGAVNITSIDGAASATINAGTGTVALGSVGTNTALTGLAVTGTTTLRGNVTAGSVTLGNVQLGNSVVVDTSAANGGITLGTVSGSDDNFTLRAGAGNASLGTTSGIYDLTISAGSTSLTGNSYQAYDTISLGSATLAGDTTFSASGTVTLGSIDSSLAAASAPKVTVNAGTVALTAGASLVAASMSVSGVAAFDASASIQTANGFSLTTGGTSPVNYSTSAAFTFSNGVFGSAGDASLGGNLNASGLSAATLILTADSVITTPSGQGTGLTVSAITGAHSLFVDNVLAFAGLDMLAGTAYGGPGTSALGAGITIEALMGGAVIGTATTDGNGAYSIAFTPTVAQGVGGTILFLIDSGSTVGNTLYSGAYSKATAVDLWGGSLRILTTGTTFSSALGSLANAIGNVSDSHILYGATTGLASGIGLDINATGTSFEVDRAFNLPKSAVTFDGTATTMVDAGSYAASSLSAGAIRLAGDVTINASGAVSIGSLEGNFNATINNGQTAAAIGNVGAGTSLASLTVSGTASLTGYSYNAGKINLGQVSLADSASINSTAVTIGPVASNGLTLAINAGAGSVALGSFTGSGSLFVAAGLTSLTGTTYQGGSIGLGTTSLSGNTTITGTGQVTLGSIDSTMTAASAPSLTVSGGTLTLTGGATLVASTMSLTGTYGYTIGSGVSIATANGFSLTSTGTNSAVAYTTASAFTLNGGVFSSVGAASLSGSLNVTGLSAPSLVLTGDAYVVTTAHSGSIAVTTISGDHVLTVDGTIVYPANAETIAGTVYSSLFNLVGVSGLTLDLLIGGTPFSGTATTGSSGAYTFVLAHQEIPSSGVPILVYLAGGQKGGVFYENVTGSASGINLFLNTLVLNSTSGTLSGLTANLAAALGSVTSSALPVTVSNSQLNLAGNLNLLIASTAPAFTIDRSINAPTVNLAVALPQGGSLIENAGVNLALDSIALELPDVSSGAITAPGGSIAINGAINTTSFFADLVNGASFTLGQTGSITSTGDGRTLTVNPGSQEYAVNGASYRDSFNIGSGVVSIALHGNGTLGTGAGILLNGSLTSNGLLVAAAENGRIEPGTIELGANAAITYGGTSNPGSVARADTLFYAGIGGSLTIDSGAQINYGAGNLGLVADTLNLNSAAGAITGSSDVILLPGSWNGTGGGALDALGTISSSLILPAGTTAASIGIAGGAGTFQVSQAMLDRLSGAGEIEIGTQGGTGAVTLGANAGTVTTVGGLRIYGASVTLASAITAGGAVILDDPLTLTGDETITAGGDLTLGGVTGTQALTLSAGGNILFDGTLGASAARLAMLTIQTANNVTVATSPLTGQTYTLWVDGFTGTATGNFSVGDHSLESAGDVSVFAASVDGRITSANVSINTNLLTGSISGGNINVSAVRIVGSTIDSTRSANVTVSQDITNTVIIAPTVSASSTNIIASTITATDVVTATATGSITNSSISGGAVTATTTNIVSSTITATDTVAATASGSITNSTISADSVQASAGGSIFGSTFTAGSGSVTATAGGSITNTTITATQAANVTTGTGLSNSEINAPSKSIDGAIGSGTIFGGGGSVNVGGVNLSSGSSVLTSINASRTTSSSSADGTSSTATGDDATADEGGGGSGGDKKKKKGKGEDNGQAGAGSQSAPPTQGSYDYANQFVDGLVGKK